MHMASTGRHNGGGGGASTKAWDLRGGAKDGRTKAVEVT